MKTIPLSLILAAFVGLWIPVASAESNAQRPERREPDGEMPARRPPTESWKIADLNQDGVISQQEFDQMPRVQKLDAEQRKKLFERLDKNQDGNIGHEEIRQMLQQEHRGEMMPRIWELDKDKDGGVSFEELQQGVVFQKLEPEKQKRIFSHLDSNGDGKITPEDQPKDRPMRDGDDKGPGSEMRKRFGDHPAPGLMIERFDQNKDHALSYEEFKANPRADEIGEEALKKRFEMMDRNRDGKISKEDFGMGPRPEGRERAGDRAEKGPGANVD